MIKNNKIINLGNTYKEVRFLHCKRNIIYFIENILKNKLNKPQKIILKQLEQFKKNINNKQ